MHVIYYDCDYCFYFIDKFPLITYEELVINCLGTLNNLTYYADVSSHLVQRLDEVTACKLAEVLVYIQAC